VNHAKNFKFKNIISRITAFIIYFISSGFTGVIIHTIFNSFMQIALRNNPALKEIILYIISLLAIFAVLFFFYMREGFADTESLS
jgi:flagellar biosynthesis protein FlhB